ncbi:Morc family cw-type zinc finger protein [Thalictrum thalictroides]|uniref:Morc family cw-type zinc finger protein n=1 Tax=Thalictrum thalictroides TaxID=46969 RepID=A0A7J6UUF6_THATH|nr:Morc family cw-type zinc finger protein [Thalictrum thalictroides]
MSSNIVDLASSEDEEHENQTRRKKKTTNNNKTPASEPEPEPPLQSNSNSSSNQPLEFRSFWKAGAYDVGSTKSIHEQGQLEHARVHPKFLHSNATSHKWAFGAIAELLDNAVDEVCKGATFVKLDKISNPKDHNPALLFQDDGGGMDPESMRLCMSLGYSKKAANTIGRYGNGFKTSTMRLGADVIVFSRKSQGSRATQSIGLLSYTFLRKTGQDDVIVPMIDFEVSGDRSQPIMYSSLDDWSNNLRNILEWSPFTSDQELMQQFEDIGPHGTKIIVYNLWLNDDGLLELDFDHDEEDIRLRDEVNLDKSLKKRDRLLESHISYQIRFSLRAYVSILYLRKFKNFNIILRGKPVLQHHIVDDLKYLEEITYRPQLGKASKEVTVRAEIGFVKEAPLLRVSGFNVYHKNRLIRPFWKLTSDNSSYGSGVVGVLEANFIEPAHDKQDFERSTLFLRLEMRIKQMCHDFWKCHCHLIGNYSIIRQQKKFPIQPCGEFAANLQREFSADQPVIGLSANMQQGMHLDQPVVGLATNVQSMSNRNTVPDQPSNMSRNTSSVQPSSRLPAGVNKDVSGDTSGSALVDQICEENIQLFMRCEEHRQKEIGLKQTIEELERELEEMKRKCSQLSSNLEIQRKLKAIGQQNGKAR